MPLEKNPNTRSKIPLFVLGIALLAVFINLLPVFVGYANSTSENIFLGFDFFDDFHNYSMYIYEAANTDHLFLQNRNNTEFDDARYFWPYFLILGKIVAFTGLPIAIVLIGSRALILIALLLACWKLCTRIFDNPEQQALAYASIAFATGFGWMVRLLQPSIEILQRIKGADLDYTNGYSTLAGSFFPLQTLAFVFFIITVLCVLHYHETRQKKYTYYATLAAFIIPFIHPPTMVLAWGSLFFSFILHLIIERKRLKQQLIEHLQLWPLAVPLIVYAGYFLWALQDPNFSGSVSTYAHWFRKDTFLVWPIGFGLLGLFALFGLKKMKFKNSYIPALLLAWVGLSLVLSQTGTGKKFLIGAHIPMALIASFGMLWILHRFFRWIQLNNVQKTAVGVVLILLLSFTHVVNIMDKSQQVLENPNSFMTKNEREAIAFLEQQSTGSVLSSYLIGDNIIWMSLHKAYLGHWGETLNIDEKIGNMKRFYDPSVDSTWKTEFLEKQRIDYVFYGPQEKSVGTIDEDLALQKVYENTTVSVFKVTQ